MPYKTEWVEPEKAVEHNGVVIYHTYHDNELDDRSEYWYSTSSTEEDEDEVGEFQFDIRDLPEWDAVKSHVEILRSAINNGHIKAPAKRGDDKDTAAAPYELHDTPFGIELDGGVGDQES